MTTYIDPPYADWYHLVHQNRAAIGNQRELLAPYQPEAIRRQVLERALIHTEALGIPSLCEQAARAANRNSVVLMAGHQPIVYHPGILFKNQLLSRLSSESGGVGINVVIDTDEGDAGRVVWPRRNGDQLTLRAGSFAGGKSLYLSQFVADKTKVREVFTQISDDLRHSGLNKAAERNEQVAELYLDMVGQPLVVANSRVRAHFEERCYLEIPLSQILTIPEVRAWIRGVLEGYESFASLYNAVLQKYRREHKIKGSVNPFPDLAVSNDSIEMPLWRVSAQREREPLRLSRKQSIDEIMADDVYLRGSMVTLLLRSLCSDLFIHGRGGAIYDPFVDAFAQAYMRLHLPKFVVASCTHYLFPEMVERFARATHLKEQFRELVSHTEGHLGTGVFTKEEDSELERLTAPRTTLLCRLHQAKNPGERSATAHELNALNRRIREFLERSSLAPLLKDAELEEGTRARWALREYPAWFINELSLK